MQRSSSWGIDPGDAGDATPELARLSRRCSNSSNVGTLQPSTHSQSLERGLAILSAFRSGRALLGISDLGREIGLSRSTTHRYVSTLAALGYLQQDGETKKYRLGPKVLDLGFSAINSMELRDVAGPHLRDLSDMTGFTVNMAILDDLDIVYVERCRSSQARQREIDLNLHVGARLPAYCTSLGKVLLAYLPPDEQRTRVGRITFTRRGPNTLTTRPSFVAELRKIRVDGFAINNEELAYGLRSIAAPVLSQAGDAVAAINIAVHRSLVSMDELLENLAPALERTAAEISAWLTLRGWWHAARCPPGYSASGGSTSRHTSVAHGQRV
jgi:IclR family pca regulon transcriptional regulator